MIQKPPFNITMEAADYLAKIVEAVTRLEFGTRFKRDIKLHRENRVRSIHSTSLLFIVTIRILMLKSQYPCTI